MAKKQKKKIPKEMELVTIDDYASRCDLTVQRIYQEISDKVIPVVVIKDRMFIDILATPVRGKKKRGKKSSAEILRNNL